MKIIYIPVLIGGLMLTALQPTYGALPISAITSTPCTTAGNLITVNGGPATTLTSVSVTYFNTTSCGTAVVSHTWNGRSLLLTPGGTYHFCPDSLLLGNTTGIAHSVKLTSTVVSSGTATPDSTCFTFTGNCRSTGLASACVITNPPFVINLS